MDIVPYEAWHLDSFEPGPWDADTTELLRAYPGWEGKAVSIREHGKTLAVVGIAQPASTALLWAVISDEFRARPMALCRMAKVSLENIGNLPGVEKVVVEVDIEFTAARRWAAWLGFTAPRRHTRWPGQNREMTWQSRQS